MDLEKRIAQLSPAKRALLEQKLRSKKPEVRPSAAAPAAPRQAYTPLSFAQERLWFLEQMEPESCLYNLPTLLPLRGTVDPAVVEASVREIVTRHAALRTRFVVKDGIPYQAIINEAREAIDFSTIDLRGGAAPAPAQLSKAVNEQIWVPFNLATGPLLRARLFLQRNGENFLLVVMHHIVSDGWSLSLFTRELRALFEAAHAGTAASLPPLPYQYVDYATRQRESLQGERLASMIAYWRQQLEGAPSLIELPLDHPRPARQSFNGALHPFRVTAPSLQNLKSLCRDCGVVPFMVLLSAFEVLLFRYTGQSKIVVGTPIANRNRSELEAIIGFFTNTLVLCSAVEPDMTFRQLLAQVRDTTLGAYEHQELPFEKLVLELQPERSLSHNPLFQVMFTFQNLPGEKSAGNDAPPPERPEYALSLDFKHSKFDLTLAMTETGDGLSAVFEYATDLFERETIERMAGHFVNVLEHVLRNPDEPLAAFSFLTPAERSLILEQWNDTRRDWPEVLPLHGRFERLADDTPDAVAVKFRDTVLSYRQLDRRAGAVARALRREGIERGSIVGICLPRSAEMVIGLFAILKAGAAYMPFEPDFPEARVGYMLEQARVTHVLTVSDCLPLLANHPVRGVALDRFDFGADDGPSQSVPVTPSDLAYVLFTSGSTGQPKGVMVSHGAIDNRLQWMQEAYNLGPADRVMQKTPYTFDVSVWEFFWTLSTGACLVVAEPERHKESLYLADLIEKEGVTCLHFVPSMLQLFLHEDLSRCRSLRLIVCSGEALTIEQCRRLKALPGVSGQNLYGPTEAAVDVTYFDCGQWNDQYLSVPIGRPISNTQIYVLNEKLQPAPVGVAGELHIGGRNLAEGYLNKPELTARQFIESPFGRLYKTGDLARFRADGNIEYIGRRDSQVKLRGLRIELGEIESVLRQYPGIAEAAVIVRRFDNHDDRLTAYVVPKQAGESIDAGAISAFVARKVPSFMVPASITAIPELPLSANGKLDRKRLPEPVMPRAAAISEPASDIERELLAIWRKFLKTDAVGTSDDFFALGGHSILATQVVNSINAHYHLEVPVRLLFENPTVRMLAAALNEFEDEAWLDDSKMAASILARSQRRLLQTLGQLTEEQLDEFLEQQAEGATLAKFDDAASLLSWAQKETAASPALPPAPAAPLAPSASGSFTAVYVQHYLDMVKTRSEIEQARLHAAEAGPARVMTLREEGSRIFERYAQEMKLHLSGNGNGDGPMTPADMRDCCIQLMSMAALAASLQET